MNSISARLQGAVAITALLLAASLASCTGGGGPRSVFAIMTGLRASIPSQVDEVTDVGLPVLSNTSDEPVRLRSVVLVGQPRAVHVLNVRAYSVNQVGYGDIVGPFGDLPSECPGQFVPHPVGSFTVRPHKLADYFVVIEFVISKPGIYHLNRVKIFYTAGGTPGWQYQNLNLTFRVSNPPLPGPRPLPKSAVCGMP